jgi:hypothetical protein
MREYKEERAFTTHTVDNDITQNFNQECINIILATISTLLYKKLLLYVFNIVHVKSMYIYYIVFCIGVSMRMAI